jgi:osmotically-inducible protein OsmY
MTARVAPLLLGAKVCFEDRWQGRVSGIDVAEDWEVLNITVSTGVLFFANSAKLPFSAVTRWTHDGVFLNIISFHAFNRQVPPVAAPSRPISSETPVAHAGARLAGLLVRTMDRRADAVLVQRGAGGPVLRVDAADAKFDGKALALSQQVENLIEYRPDGELLESIRRALREDTVLPLEERRTLVSEVSDGVVTLSGNTRTGQTAEALELTVRRVAGILTVRNNITNDVDLETSIGLEIDRAGLSRRAEVHARSNLGDVTLYGYAPSSEAIAEIARAVTRLPGVRTVTSRMETRAAVA